MNLEGVVKVEEVLHLVVGDAAVYDGLLAGVDHDEWQGDGGVGGGGALGLLALLIALDKVLKGDLL